MSSPATTIRRKMAEAARQGHRDRRPAPGRLVALSPPRPVARRAADPSRAALVGDARARRPASRSSATSSCSAASGRGSRRRALRRDHRHQRQVDHDGADRPHPARGRPRRADGRQYRHRDPVARAAGRRAASTSSSARRSRSISRRRSRRRSASSSTSRRIISTGTARWRTMPRSRSGWWRGADTAVIGVDDDAEPRHRAQRTVPVDRTSCAIGLSDQEAGQRFRGEGVASCPASTASASRDRATSPASARCAATHNAQNAAAAVAVALLCGVGCRYDRSGRCAAFPACRTAWRRSAAAARRSSSTIPRPPTRIRPRRR